MIKRGAVRKFIAVLANFSLLLNSFIPILIAVTPAYAQEAPPVETSAIVESAPTPETPTITESAPIISPTPEINSATIENLSPAVAISPTPTEVPVNTEIGTLTPTSEITITPEPAIIETPIVTDTPNSNTNEFTPPPEIIPEPTPTEIPFLNTTVFEKVCLTDEQITDTTNEEWIINDTNGISETKNKVKLGVKYIYPQESKVSIIFKCLPKDENLRTTLKIQKIKTSDLNLPSVINNIGEYAYDITTGMTDGNFEYDVTLPKPENSTAEISYIEKTIDQAKSNLNLFDIKSIDNSKTEQSGDTVKATSIDHFTIFIATYTNNSFSTEKNNYLLGETVYVKAGDLDPNHYYKLSLNPPQEGDNNSFYITNCFDPDIGNTILSNTYNLTIADSTGNWEAELKEFDNAGCNSDQIIDERDNYSFSVDAPVYSPTRICHATKSDINNPYVSETPNNSGQLMGHVGSSHQNGEDIIPPITFYLPLGQNWTPENQAIYNNNCKLVNKGHLIVQKTTIPTGNQTVFSVNTTSNTGGTITGGGLGTITDYLDKNYEVTPGTYSVIETVPIGWSKTGDTCQNVVVGAGETKYCTITNTRNTGIIRIKKVMVGGTDTFNFIGSLVGSVSTNEGTIQKTVDTGSYSSVELAKTGWNLTNISCDDGNSIGNISNRTATFNVEAGETVTCTFTNTKLASLKIIKDSQPDDTQNFIFRLKDSSSQQIGFTELDDDNVPSSRPNNYTFSNLTPATYTVYEDSVSGWTLDDITCTNTTSQWSFENGHLNININPGEQPVCTFTNTKKGTIIVKKDMIGGTDSFNFTGSLSGSISTDLGTIQTSVVPGQYTSTESDKTGWNLTNVSCSDGNSIGNISNRTATFNVEAGETVTCTFTNNKFGSISGRKFYDKNGDGNRDSNENYLEGWKIFIDQDNDSKYDTGESYYLTDSNGNYNFNNLTPATYRVCEEMQSDYYNSTPICQSAIVTDGSNITKNFGNMMYGSIKVCKVIIDGSGNIVNGSETLGSTFTIDWDRNLTDTVFSAGYTPNTKIFSSSAGNDAICITYGNLPINTYHYSQEVINNNDIWQIAKYNDQYESTIDNINNFYNYNTNPDSNGEIDLTNNAGINRTLVILNQYKFGSVNVTKFNDLDGDGQKDEGEENLPDWTINLTNQESKTTDETGQVFFGKLTANTYYLSEDLDSQPGWTQTNIYCEGQNESVCGDGVRNDDEQCDDGNQVDNDGCSNTCQLERLETFNQLFRIKPVIAQEAPTGYRINLTAGQNLNCYTGNQRLEPVTTISKTNNVTGNLSPGNSVEYTINLTIADNNVNNLKVTDLLSNGFIYQSGSYHVYRSGTEVTSLVPAPTYHSPGVWDLTNLGELTPEDEIKLVYTANISTDQQAGTYKDLAWSIASYAHDSTKKVLALAQPIGYIATNFVGTEVPVVKNNQNSVSAEVERKQVIEGQVLGVSTELPGTGAATIWIIISSILGALGLGLIIYSKRSKQKMIKKIISIFIFSIISLFLFNPKTFAVSNNLSIQVEEPKSPTNIKDIELKFVTLDINGEDITAKCFKKSPTDSSFSQFGSDIVLADGGNASHCNLSSAINDNGSYQFYVEAFSLSGSAVSQTINLDYKNSTPGNPSNYSKEQINNCDFKIHFKTADDGGKTVKVELYRSSDSAFSANNESLVHSLNIGSNQEATILNNVPDCSKTYYFVLRAFDDAGNGSGIVGDTITISTSTTTTTVGTTTIVGAIPIIGSNNIPPENVISGTNPEPETVSSKTTPEGGEVLGVKANSLINFIKQHKFSIGLSFFYLFVITVYVIFRIRRNKR